MRFRLRRGGSGIEEGGGGEIGKRENIRLVGLFLHLGAVAFGFAGEPVFAATEGVHLC
jgi:hypothetical protein